MKLVEWMLVLVLLSGILGCTVRDRGTDPGDESRVVVSGAKLTPESGVPAQDSGNREVGAEKLSEPEYQAEGIKKGEKTAQSEEVAGEELLVVEPSEFPRRPRQEPRGAEKSLYLTAPTESAWIASMVCNIQGKASGYVDGTSLKLFVQDKWDVVFGQDCHPEVEGERFDGFVYLGSQWGQGVGEAFRIWTEDAAGCRSNIVTVIRSQ